MEHRGSQKVSRHYSLHLVPVGTEATNVAIIIWSTKAEQPNNDWTILLKGSSKQLTLTVASAIS